MKTIPKHIIIFSGFSIFLFLGYIALQNTNVQSSQSDEINKPLSQSDKEAHTGKSLNIVSQSGGEWGNNPFATGTTSSGNIKKLEFVKPNTEWKTRTLSGITYVFGEGNPKEVALNIDELRKSYKRCGTSEDPENSSMLCRENSGYISKEVEKHLVAALSDPNWSTLMTLCEENLRVLYRNELDISMENQFFPSYDKIFYKNYLDIENFIFIRSDNGLKDLRVARVIALNQWLRWSTMAGWTLDTEWPINSDGSKMIFKDPTCVDKYGKEIIRNLMATQAYYSHPVEIFGQIPLYLLDSKLFKIY